MLDCGCSETELVEPFALVVDAVPALGVWFCGAGVVWFCSGAALFNGGFSGVVVFGFVGLATLPAAWPAAVLEAGVCEDALLWEEVVDETPGPRFADDGLHVSAICFTLATVKVLFDMVDDWV